MPDQKRYYINDTGTGNTANLSHPRVLQMVMDSLRYWVDEMHVDGFRFDLGTVLAREPNGFDNQSGFLKACSQDPLLTTVKLIAEPWDCGPGGYQVGQFPPGWAEWNDRFRDTVRDFWKGAAPPADLAPRLCASGDLFDQQGRRPWTSVNFVSAHDGFTLNDLVTYNDRHNEANGDENRDGASDNRSWNCGAEGPTDDQEINALRDRQVRNILTTLLVAQGTPMLLAGDEFARTQQGNNNAYCQDNAISWVDWDISERGRALVKFVRKLTKLRQDYPILRRDRFLTGKFDDELGIKEVAWFNGSGAEMGAEDWTNGAGKAFAMLIDGRAQPTGLHKKGSDATILLVFNAGQEPVRFVLPAFAGAVAWRCVIDTAVPEGEERIVNVGQDHDQDHEMAARSLLVWVLVPQDA